MLRIIRTRKGLTSQELGDILGHSKDLINTWERTGDNSSIILTKYLENIQLTKEQRNLLESARRNNWEYREDLHPITNDLRRIRNGLGRSTKKLSEILGQYDSYWAQLELNQRSLSSRDFGMLDKYFNISSTTLRRHELIVERSHSNQPPLAAYKNHNSEVQEPKGLYNHPSPRTQPSTYMPLLHEIERENGGSIQNASESDPKLIHLRQLMGTKYYDKDGNLMT